MTHIWSNTAVFQYGEASRNVKLSRIQFSDHSLLRIFPLPAAKIRVTLNLQDVTSSCTISSHCVHTYYDMIYLQYFTIM
jgi:hypothetical protein